MAQLDKLTINVVIDDKKLLQNILKEIVRKLNSVLSGSGFKVKIKNEIARLIDFAIKASPEYEALTFGDLRGFFGIVNPEQAIDDIIRHIISDMEIIIYPVKIIGVSFSGGISISFSREDASDALSSKFAEFKSEKGKTVPWLSWLLLKGDETILIDYEVILANFPNPPSRTQEGLTFQTPNHRETVPAEFSGVAGSNWITRALFGIEEYIFRIIESEFNNRL